jgi:capsular polysaccharide biosynthesis protein
MEFLKIIKEKWQTVLVITVLVAAVVFSISAFLKPQYGSEVSILVIQRQPSDDVDAFSAAKSAEYLSDILAKIAYSESFIENVLDSPYDAQMNFPIGADKKKESWKKKIDVDQVNNTGIIKITVYDQDRENAEKIAEAISWAYIIRGHQYHGGGDRVEIEKIDGPITPINPLKPNLLLNTLLGIILGLIGSVAVIYFFEDFELKIFGRKKKDRIKGGDDQDSDQGSIGGIMKFREKHKDYASFDDYIFDKKRNSEKKDVDLGEVVIDEKEISKKELSNESEKTEVKKENKVEKKNKEKKIVEIKEPYCFEGELSFENAIVGGDKKVEPVIPVFQSKGLPGNLPTFEGDINSLVKSEDENVKEGDKKDSNEIDKDVTSSYDRESTEDEVKERLNKLLRGEM